MASFKLMMRSSDSRNSDLSPSLRSQQFNRDPNTDQSRITGGYGGCNDGFSSTTMTVEGILLETFASDPPATESSLLDASMEITSVPDVDRGGGGTETCVDEVWREFVSGEGNGMKEETQEEIMTLEDFLAKAAVEDASDDLDVKIPPEYRFDNSAPPSNPFEMIDKVEGPIVAYGNGVDVYGGKRARVMVEPLDKAAAQRQRRMIKNRESAARSRERKQAYQVELESLAAKLEEENEMLSKEIKEKKKQRYNKLMEFVIPVVEKPAQQPQPQPRILRRIQSLEW